MKIVIIGAGNVASHIAQALSDSHEIAQVYSRSLEHAIAVAEPLGASAINDLEQVATDADVYLLSITDDALPSVIDRLAHVNDRAVWAHTAGSRPMELFAGKMARYGVFYPLQTFTKGVPVEMSKVPFFIEAVDDATLAELDTLAQSISTRVYHADSAMRKRMHVASVFACNFTNYLWSVADRLLSDHDIPFDVLAPLLEVTLNKALTIGPKAAQTGPARRGDRGVIEVHLAMLHDGDRDIYRLLSDEILKAYEQH